MIDQVVESMGPTGVVLSYLLTAATSIVVAFLTLAGVYKRSGSDVQQSWIKAGFDAQALVSAAEAKMREEIKDDRDRFAEKLEEAQKLVAELRIQLAESTEVSIRLRSELDARDRYVVRLKRALDNRDSRISSLEAKVDTLEARQATLEEISDAL